MPKRSRSGAVGGASRHPEREKTFEEVVGSEESEEWSESGGGEGEEWEEDESEDVEEEGEWDIDEAEELAYEGGRFVEDRDSEEEEEIGLEENTIGDVPLHWYDDYDHIGYNIEGEQIARPERKDELDQFLDRSDGSHWRRVWDEKNQREIVLTSAEMKVLRNVQKGRYPNPGYDPYEDLIELEHKDSIHPLLNTPEPKSRFVPSKWEAKKIGYLVQAIRKGWIQLDKEKDAKKKQREEPTFFMLWDESTEAEAKNNKRWNMHIPAPRMPLPGHNESYRPPPEYLLSEEERKAWELLDPEDRPYNFLPRSHERLRSLPMYRPFVRERFERCLDLYLCPRSVKQRQNVDPDSLLPKLPSPSELRPFPSRLSLSFKGHEGRVRSLSVGPTGQWLVSGGDDRTVRLWEVSSGRCAAHWRFDDVVKSVAFSPNADFPVILAVTGKSVHILDPELVDEEHSLQLEAVLAGDLPADGTGSVTWARLEAEGGARLSILHGAAVDKVTWHAKGDYFASVCCNARRNAVLVHRLSDRRTQNPFRKNKDLVQDVAFHPNKPFFFVATERHVRVYNLLRQQLMKKLQAGVQCVSSLAVHPGGDNLIVGSYDKRVCWFDLDYSARPYRVLRYHKRAVRAVAYHPRYPLFASTSDDCTVHIFHGMVYNDLLQNPLLVPVKILKGHTQVSDLGILACEFHPTQPWLFTSGADGQLLLFT